MTKPICANCRFAGKAFKVGKNTHHHCENRVKFPKEDYATMKISAWDSLVEWYYTCIFHQYKEGKNTTK